MKKLAIIFCLFASNVLACEKVIKVIDGDTIETNKTGRIRILGIDTFDTVPNRVQKQIKRTGLNKSDVLHFSEAGKNFAIKTLLNKCIAVEKDYKDIDIYNRKLRYIIVDDVDYSLLVITKGLAMSYCEDKRIKNFKKYNEASLWRCE
jgi:endonuclease YncB( thermonuclease family)